MTDPSPSEPSTTDAGEAIVQRYAELLTQKAGSMALALTVAGTLAGAVLGLVASKMPGGIISPGVRTITIFLGAVAGGLLGRSIGGKRAALLRLQAALALHQGLLAQQLQTIQRPAAAPPASLAPPQPVALQAPAVPEPLPVVAPVLAPVVPEAIAVDPLPVVAEPEPEPVPAIPLDAAPIAVVPRLAPAAPPVVAPAPAPVAPEPAPELEAVEPTPTAPTFPRLVEDAPAMPPLSSADVS
ncbi:MAG TPA: hypothetical protein VFA56_12575 [Gaiellaceae bacterium]|nr:hypothetical protein [Gaiellaceae bacterium]